MEITTAGSYVAITKEAKLEFTANRNDLHHLSLKEEIPQLSRKGRVSGNFYRNPVGTQKCFIRGGSASGSNPLIPFYIPFLTEKVPLLLYLLLTNGTYST